MVDAAEGALGVEWIEGKSIRHLLPGGAEEEEDLVAPEVEHEDEAVVAVDSLREYGISVGM
jgi:TP53 regulating kinase-like protein